MTTFHNGRLRYRRSSHLSLALLVAVFTLFGLWLGSSTQPMTTPMHEAQAMPFAASHQGSTTP